MTYGDPIIFEVHLHAISCTVTVLDCLPKPNDSTTKTFFCQGCSTIRPIDFSIFHSEQAG